MNPFVPEYLQHNLILASASERRREILDRLGFAFEVLETGIEESGVACADDLRFAMMLAEMKGAEARRMRPAGTIIAADTIVVCEGIRLGKPADRDGARTMLRRLSGRPHDVITGIALFGDGGAGFVNAERTLVVFRPLTERDIERYIDTGEPFGKAGAYAIQGHAAPFIERIEGCYFNVVGLPVALLFRMFAELERIRA
jgi:septum formation protein